MLIAGFAASLVLLLAQVIECGKRKLREEKDWAQKVRGTSRYYA